MLNSKILTFRRKCKPTGILLGDCINEAEQLTAAALEKEMKEMERKKKDFLRKSD